MSFLAPLAGALGGGLGTALQVGGGIIGTLGSIGQMNYQAQVAKNNASIAAENAQKASDQAQQEQVLSDQQTVALVGEQEAIQGGSGLNLGSGSQLRTRRTAQRLGRTDAQRIREQGNANIQGFLQQRENFLGEARVAKSNMFGAAIGGALDVAGKLKPSLAGGARSVRSPNRLDPWNGLRSVTV
jgi:hypothetical protein